MKKIIWISVFVCSTIFGFVPLLWGGELFSIAGVVFNGLGGLFGVWLGYKISGSF